MNTLTPIPAVDGFLAAVGAQIVHRPTEAGYYIVHDDYILMPPPGAWSTAVYYSVLLHEHAHWTGHATRLTREYGFNTLTDVRFLREEIVAITAALHLCAYFGLPAEAARTQLDYSRKFVPYLHDRPDVVAGAIADGRRAALFLHAQCQGEPVAPESALFRSVDALTLACFTAPLPPPAARLARAPLAPLIARFGTMPRVGFT